MSAPFPLGPVPILRGSRYAAYSLSLLASACAEQKGRLRALVLLFDYLASGAGGRKRELIAKEMQALLDLYEAVWCELDDAFGARTIRSAREAVEQQQVPFSVSSQRELFL
ncbi:MAG TPA: hypothetical protein VF283_17490 [Bryobacteraceae bacterium]